MDADGVETRHFCHRVCSCSLKAVCAHPKSTHRRFGVHRLQTVDRRGTVLISRFAHSFHPGTPLPMHTLKVAMRSTLSSVRRSPMDTTLGRLETRVLCVFFRIYMTVPGASPQLLFLAQSVCLGLFWTHIRSPVMRDWLFLLMHNEGWPLWLW